MELRAVRARIILRSIVFSNQNHPLLDTRVNVRFAKKSKLKSIEQLIQKRLALRLPHGEKKIDKRSEPCRKHGERTIENIKTL
jgi:hypothetical protein